MDEPKVKYRGFLVDTNIVNDAMDGRLDFQQLRELYGPGYCTKHLERELLATRDPDRRDKLVAYCRDLGLEEVDSATAAAMTAAPDIASGIWGDVAALNAGVLSRADRPHRARTQKAAHVDALQAEAAKREGLTLATGDAPLADTAEAAGIPTERTRK
jgi:rRNA-processing protein FCF1